MQVDSNSTRESSSHSKNPATEYSHLRHIKNFHSCRKMVSPAEGTRLQWADEVEDATAGSREELVEISIQDENSKTCAMLQSKTAFTAPSAGEVDSGATESTITRDKRIITDAFVHTPRLQFPVWILTFIVIALMIVTCGQAVGWGAWTATDRQSPPPIYLHIPVLPVFVKPIPNWAIHTYHALLTLFGVLFLVHSIAVSVSARAIVGRVETLPIHDEEVQSDDRSRGEGRWKGWMRNLGLVTGILSALSFIASGILSSEFQSHAILLTTAMFLFWFWAFVYIWLVATASLDTFSDVLNIIVMAIAAATLLFSTVFAVVMRSMLVLGSTVLCGYCAVGSAVVLLFGVGWNNRPRKMVVVTQFGMF